MSGDVVILLHDDDLNDYIPSDTNRIFISDLKQSTNPAEVFVRCFVKKRWPTQKTRQGSLIKTVVADGDGDTDAICVFFVGDLADQCSLMAFEDTVLLSNFFIENLTNLAGSNHSCQLLLDKRRSNPRICILHKTQQQQVPRSTTTANDNVQPSTSRQQSTSENREQRSTESNTVQGTSNGEQATRPRVASTYTYTELRHLKKDTVVNLYGVVKFVKQPSRTKGTDYMMLVSVVDSSLESLDQKLKCVLFAREQHCFPSQAEVGDIIRLHRLKISEFNGDLQGKNGPGFSLLLFDNKSSASLTPKFKSSHHYTITGDDYDRITKLRTWWNSLQVQNQEEVLSLPRCLTLSDVQCGQYFDLLCQVVAISAMNPQDGCLLKVWDGTKVVIPIHDVDVNGNEIRWDTSLAKTAADYLVDVCVFDDHFARSAHCQPGQFVKFFNLHAMKHKNADETHSAVPTAELCLHGGTSYGRGMRIFDDTDDLVQGLKKKLEDIVNDSSWQGVDQLYSTPQRDQRRSPRMVTRSCLANKKTPMKETTNQEVVRRSPRLNTPSSSKGKSRKRPLDVATPSTSAKRQILNDDTSSNVPRCMTNTATVITAHHHIVLTSIKDIQNHSVPYKFRVQVRIMDYQPQTNTARDMIKLACPKCNFLSPLPESKAAIEAVNSWAATASADCVHNGIPQFYCPTCIKHHTHKSIEPIMLKYIYMFQFIVYDETGWLMLQLVRDDAEKFFSDTPAEELLRKRKSFSWIQSQLRKLCPSRNRDKNRPLLDACIKSYSTPSVGLGTSYQMFDTVLASQEDSL